MTAIHVAISDEARRLRSLNLSWTEIGRRLGVSSETAHYAADPDYAERRRLRNTAKRRLVRHPTKNRRIESRPSEIDAFRVLSAVPRDTRDLTARVLGDPLPGRSALDQKNGARP